MLLELGLFASNRNSKQYATVAKFPSRCLTCKMLVLCSLLLLFVPNFTHAQTITDEEYNALPPIYKIDDYEQCRAANKTFCRVSLALEVTQASPHYQTFKKLDQNIWAYNHSELYHAICLEDFCPQGLSLQSCFSEQYNPEGFQVQILQTDCKNYDNTFEFKSFDKTILSLILLYLTWLIAASIIDIKQIPCGRFRDTLIKPFSISENWKKLNKINSSPEFQKLKCIQGIRFYNTLLIIFCHTFCSFIGGYIANTRYFEEFHLNPFKNILRSLLMFLVQTFFLFSSWLLSYHLFQIMSKQKFNLKVIGLTFINRYLRILPPVLLMIALSCTVIIYYWFKGPVKNLYIDKEYERCLKNWWTTLLFINNHYNYKEMCYFIMWYLAADIQLYLVSLIVLALIWNCQRKAKQILVCFILLAVAIPTVITYYYDLDFVFRLKPESVKKDFRSFEFYVIYCSTYANMATYMVGIVFGYVYFKKGSKEMFGSKWKVLVFWLVFLGLPSIVLYYSSFVYSRAVSAILAGITKPLYAIGIGVGILGMSQNIGGWVKRICEWEPALFLGNFTYSTYVVHYGIVFYRTAIVTEPVHMTDFVLVKAFLHDIVLSFACGFIMHLSVEMPVLQLQNLFVPQVRKHRLKSN